MHIDLNKKSREQIVQSAEFAQEVEKLSKDARVEMNQDELKIIDVWGETALSVVPFGELRMDLYTYLTIINDMPDKWPVSVVMRMAGIVLSSTEVQKNACRLGDYISVVKAVVSIHDKATKIMQGITEKAISTIEARQKIKI